MLDMKKPLVITIKGQCYELKFINIFEDVKGENINYGSYYDGQHYNNIYFDDSGKNAEEYIIANVRHE